MDVLNLEPKEVFRYFKEMSDIPRPSYKEKAISDYLVAFAKEHQLEYYQDKLFNVIMIKEASVGYEDKPAIILQGHMDMVCETAPDCTKDMDKEGLDLEVEGDFLSAKGTTLGADDGIAVAYALALLSDETLKHPRLEFVCTVSEEVGMDGAREIDCSMLKGKLLLNMDNEKEGQVLASCAGGGTARITFPVSREKSLSGDEVAVEISLLGGRGGHSGDEIDKGRGNASILMGRILRHVATVSDFKLISVTGGSKDNAIPREARVQIALSKANVEAVKKAVATSSEEIALEFAKTDSGLHATCEETEAKFAPFTKEVSDQYMLLLASLPNGIRRMSRDIEGLVETSLNLGINNTEEDKVVIGYSVRSSVGSSYTALVEKLKFICEGMGCKVEMYGEYPAWEFVEGSKFREKLQKVYKDMFGEELKICAIHAGVECGLLSAKIEGLDAISMGPNIYDIHTPDERLSISSAKRGYEFVRKVIEEI
ncbi:MAG: aminoacyl-histidine dipeptidase [Lachnospiraceae bacterium]|nr:aminoacyl-histidine dipeptidase [Lachnospiraceae bacterium]